MDGEKEKAQERRRAALGTVRPGTLWRHHAGAVCVVESVAALQEGLRIVVAFRYLDTGNAWAHFLEDFLADAGGKPGVPRFRPEPPWEEDH